MAAAEPIIDVRLVQHPVALEPLASIPQPAGGECIFLGRTRAETHPQHGQLMKLSYEAYVPMAQHVLSELALEAVKRWNCLVVRIHHAIGDVPLGEASVLVQVLCAHRQAAFEACRFLIDELKSKAPIWKREMWADGTTWSAGAPVSSGLAHAGTAPGGKR